VGRPEARNPPGGCKPCFTTARDGGR
jgi:hypothetical protein